MSTLKAVAEAPRRIIPGSQGKGLTNFVTFIRLIISFIGQLL